MNLRKEKDSASQEGKKLQQEIVSWSFIKNWSFMLVIPSYTIYGVIF